MGKWKTPNYANRSDRVLFTRSSLLATFSMRLFSKLQFHLLDFDWFRWVRNCLVRLYSFSSFGYLFLLCHLFLFFVNFNIRSFCFSFSVTQVALNRWIGFFNAVAYQNWIADVEMNGNLGKALKNRYRWTDESAPWMEAVNVCALIKINTRTWNMQIEILLIWLNRFRFNFYSLFSLSHLLICTRSLFFFTVL